MEIAVIIVSYNFERWLDQCLGSLRKSTQPVDVIVVDNCSTDNTIKLVEEYYPEVFLIKNQRNEGFGKANNIGISQALNKNCNFVFLLNQDAWLDADTIEKLIEIIQKHPNFGILSPIHLNGKGDALDKGFSLYTGLREKINLSVLQKKSSDPIPVRQINAALWMLPKKTLKEIGGFSPVFHHYGEDMDYINRLHYHGYEIGYCPVAFGYHDRESRKPQKEDLLFQLIEYSNINRNFFSAFGYGVLGGFKKAFIALFDTGPKEFYRLFSITIKILLKSNVVIQFRRINKKPSEYYFLD